MRLPRSLQVRLALLLGVLLTALWIAAAWATVSVLEHEMEEVFDSALQEAAQRLLPLAVLDVVGREDDGVTQRLGAVRAHDEFFTYVVRDAKGRVLLKSHAADVAVFPDYDGPGFRQTGTHRLFNEEALQGSVRITVAEPLQHRADSARNIQMVLGLPILFVIPLALLAIGFAVRATLAPLRRFQLELEARHSRDLSPVVEDELPSEVIPVAATLNSVLARLKAAFEAERSFASNAAHELRTPLAGAIAQAQRLQSETKDKAAALRAADIEATLKRLTRLSERLMQLARAEGGRLRLDNASDLRMVARLIADDIGRMGPAGRIVLSLPEQPVMSDLDPDAFGIVCRNLVENALRHGDVSSPVEVTLSAEGEFRVSNEADVVPSETLSRLTERFERAGAGSDGSGLGLAIVAAIADRVGSSLVLKSPRPHSTSGFEASVKLPEGIGTFEVQSTSASNTDP